MIANSSKLAEVFTFILVFSHLHCGDTLIVFPLLFWEFFCKTSLNRLPLQNGSQSGSLILSQSSHWISKPSWITLVPRGAVSSPWKTTTMKVGSDFLHVNWPTNLLSTAQLCHWPLTSGVLRWQVSIGPTAEAPCLLADETRNVTSPLWRQDSGIVVHFANARVCNEACCQLSLAKRVPTGFGLTQIPQTVLCLW